MGLIEPPGHVIAGEVLLDGRRPAPLDEREMEAVRGARIGMVFQDPLTSLNPALTIGSQIAETILAHEPVSRAEAERARRRRCWHMSAWPTRRRVPRLSAPFQRRHAPARADRRRDRLPPEIIIADEPTTALDVTVQAKILRLLYDLQQEMHASLLLITHDLGVVAAMADDVLVMYAGRVVERADVDTLFHAPRHPYTRALLGCIAGIEDDRSVAAGADRGRRAGSARIRRRAAAFAPRCPPRGTSACRPRTRRCGRVRPPTRRPASAPRRRPMSDALLAVEGLSKSFRARARGCSGRRCAPCPTSASRSRAARRWASSARAAAASPPWRAWCCI